MLKNIRALFFMVAAMFASPAFAQEADLGEAGFDLASLVTAGGMTADQAAERAVRSAPSLERSRASVLVAEASADRALAGLFPRVEVSARYTRLSDVEQGGLGAGLDQSTIDLIESQIGMVSDPAARNLFTAFLQAQLAVSGFEFPLIVDQYSFRASLTYPVSDVFLSVLPARSASLSLAESARIRSQVEEATVALRARESFYQLVRARGALAVAESALVQVTANRDRTRALVEAGVLAPVDLMRVEAQVASSRVGVARARGGVSLAEQAVRVLLHDESEEPIAIGEDVSAPIAPIETPRRRLIQTALSRRLEIRALELSADASDDLATSRGNARWPRIGVQANLDVANPNPRVFPQTEEFGTTWDVSAFLSWSPNDLATAEMDESESAARASEIRADLESFRDAVRLEVAQAYDAFESARAQLEAANVGIEAAEEAYRVRQRQLEAGAVATSDVIDAEAELTRARLEYLESAIGARIAKARLDRAVGP
jgi:outer membrane protein TolC